MRILTLVVCALATTVPSLARAGKAPAYATLALVPAQCGQLTYGPCAPAFAFKSATLLLTGSKEPTPACPKTGDPSEAKAGSVRMTGVTKNGAPFTGSLPTETVLKTTFGENPNSTCVLPGTQFVGSSLMGDVVCRNGKCKGTIIPIFCLPPDCIDVAITTEFVSFKVMDDSGSPDGIVAAPGTVIAPKR